MAQRFPDSQYRALADFRHRIRQFLTFSENAAREAGLTPQQHQLLLALSAADDGVSVGELAGRLLLRHHSVVGLVDRLQALGYVSRERDLQDRRRVTVRLTRAGEQALATLSVAHRRELRAHGPALVQALTAILSEH